MMPDPKGLAVVHRMITSPGLKRILDSDLLILLLVLDLESRPLGEFPAASTKDRGFS